MPTFKVLLVDDEYDEVHEAITLLRATGLVAVVHADDYSRLGTRPEDCRQAVKDYDFLVLDVLMRKHQDGPFINFVSAVRGLKPFLAYTMMEGDQDIKLPSGAVELREWVFQNGGVGVLTKTFGGYSSTGMPSNHDMQLALVERVINFYWLTR